MRLRAEAGDVDARGGQARSLELVAVGLRQIEIGAARCSRRKPAGQRVSRMTCLPKGIHDLRADLSAAWPQARTDCCHEIGRQRSERPLHRAHRGSCGAVDRSAPTRVRGPHSAKPAISQQDRRAIRHPYTDRAGGIIAHDHVSLRR